MISDYYYCLLVLFMFLCACSVECVHVLTVKISLSFSTISVYTLSLNFFYCYPFWSGIYTVTYMCQLIYMYYGQENIKRAHTCDMCTGKQLAPCRM